MHIKIVIIHKIVKKGEKRGAKNEAKNEGKQTQSKTYQLRRRALLTETLGT